MLPVFFFGGRVEGRRVIVRRGGRGGEGGSRPKIACGHTGFFFLGSAACNGVFSSRQGGRGGAPSCSMGTLFRWLLLTRSFRTSLFRIDEGGSGASAPFVRGRSAGKRVSAAMRRSIAGFAACGITYGCV